MLRMSFFIIITIASLVSANIMAAGNPELGAKLYKKCVSCHGKDGYGKKSQKAPMIAAQYDWYIISQVKNIRDGKRANKNTKKMYPFVKKLSDADIDNLAAYISKLAPKK